MAKITIESEGNGVLFNGALVGKEGWVLSTSGDQSKVTLTNKITGLSGSALTTEVEVNGSTFADYDALVAALGPILFKGAGTGPGSGVQSVTGDGVGGTVTDPVLTFPTPAEIGAATSAQGALAETAVQPDQLDIVQKYYVSSTGSDSNDGLSPETPWLSYTNILTLPIDVKVEILFKSGESFTGTLAIIDRLLGTKVGTYGGYDRATIAIDTGGTRGITFYNCSNVVLDNIRVVGLGAGTWNNSAGIFIYNDANLLGVNYKIQRCEVTDVGGYGISVGMDAEPGTIKIKGLEISDCSVHGNIDGIFTYGNKDAEYSIEECIVENNEVYDNLGSSSVTWVHSGSGIMLCGLSGGIVRHNKAWNNGENSNYEEGGPYGIWLYNCLNTVISHCESFDNSAAGIADGGGFDIDGGCQGCVIEYCYSHNNYGPGILFYQFGDAPHTWENNSFRFNTSYNDGRGGNSGGIMYGSVIDKGFIHDNKFYYDSEGLAISKGLIFSWLEEDTINIDISRNLILLGDDIPALPSPSAKLSLSSNVVISTEDESWINLIKNTDGKVDNVSASKTLTLADGATYQRATAAITITIPTNGTVAFAIGTEMDFFQADSGAITFVAAGGVTINSYDDVLVTDGKGAAATLKKVGTNEWDLII